MINVTHKIRIKKPADVVYKAYIDPDNSIKWQEDLVAVEQLRGRYGETGAESRLHYRQGKNNFTREEKTEFVEPGKKIISIIHGSGLHVTVEVIFTADDWETDLIMNWSGNGTGLLSNFTMRFSEQKIKIRLEKELQTFQELVEAYGVKFR